jgi:hypothetical protein
MKRVLVLLGLVAALALSVGAATVLAKDGADDPPNHDAGENACLSDDGPNHDAGDDHGGGIEAGDDSGGHGGRGGGHGGHGGDD